MLATSVKTSLAPASPASMLASSSRCWSVANRLAPTRCSASIKVGSSRDERVMRSASADQQADHDTHARRGEDRAPRVVVHVFVGGARRKLAALQGGLA